MVDTDAPLPPQDVHPAPLKQSSNSTDGTPSSAPRSPTPDSNPMPVLLMRYASLTDRSLLRLQRLLASTVGLETFLSTVNYVLYILISINPRSNPSPASLESLTTLISDTRTTLRLTALLPLYSSLRAQLTDRAKKDRYLRAISLIQCIAYIFFQFTENVAFLADRGIISQRRLARAGGSTKWWIWSSRAWLAGVSCDFLKLFREALIERQQKDLSTRTSKEEVSAEAKHERMAGSKWWSEVFIASCWLPLCLHYSLQDGLLGMNNRVVGLLGLMAGAQGCTAQWAKTNIT